MSESLSSPAPAHEPRCRLCDGALELQFRRQVLGQFDVGYFRCQSCHSLQTERPYWLEQAYRANNLSSLDTGAAQRNLHNLAACCSIAKLLRLKNVLDVGGGDGLLCRLLRDYELNCFVHDKYASPTYAQGFELPDFAQPDLIVAFEVLEHYPEPRKELQELFAKQPKAVLASTGIFNSQGADWWYLAPESGQHVFFYSEAALQLIARTHDYELIVSSGYLLFLRRGVCSGLKKSLAKTLLRSAVRRFTRVRLAMSSADGVWKDHLLQLERAKSRSAS
jgi:2-polyprenyl-3-methyl-5-hydroxy-6-metoxy-1,4-benzoquinol methylase